MSTAGIYNYNPKVTHPDAVLPQMASASHQPPFFFGGSQIPINIGIKGSGFKTSYVNSIERPKFNLQRKASTSVEKHQKIMLPFKGSGLY
jgi:hypothetical protein